MKHYKTEFYRQIKILILTDGKGNFGYSIVDIGGVEIDSNEPFTGTDFEANGLLPSCREFIDWHLKECLKDIIKERAALMRKKKSPFPPAELTSIRLIKTTLPENINSFDEAKAYLKALYDNDESYHPEDSAADCFPGIHEQDAHHMDFLMKEVYQYFNANNADPCEFILQLDPDYKME